MELLSTSSNPTTSSDVWAFNESDDGEADDCNENQIHSWKRFGNHQAHEFVGEASATAEPASTAATSSDDARSAQVQSWNGFSAATKSQATLGDDAAQQYTHSPTAIRPAGQVQSWRQLGLGRGERIGDAWAEDSKASTTHPGPTGSLLLAAQRRRRHRRQLRRRSQLPGNRRRTRSCCARRSLRRRFCCEFPDRFVFGTAPDGAHWVASRDSNCLFRFADATLRGIGQVYLTNNPWSGLLYLVAVTAGEPQLGIMCLLGTLMSTATAMWAGLDAGAIASGLFGYNGCLTGIALALFHWPGPSANGTIASAWGAELYWCVLPLSANVDASLSHVDKTCILDLHWTVSGQPLFPQNSPLPAPFHLLFLNFPLFFSPLGAPQASVPDHPCCAPHVSIVNPCDCICWGSPGYELQFGAFDVSFPSRYVGMVAGGAEQRSFPSGCSGRRTSLARRLLGGSGHAKYDRVSSGWVGFAGVLSSSCVCDQLPAAIFCNTADHTLLACSGIPIFSLLH